MPKGGSSWRRRSGRRRTMPPTKRHRTTANVVGTAAGSSQGRALLRKGSRLSRRNRADIRGGMRRRRQRYRTRQLRHPPLGFPSRSTLSAKHRPRTTQPLKAGRAGVTTPGGILVRTTTAQVVATSATCASAIVMNFHRTRLSATTAQAAATSATCASAIVMTFRRARSSATPAAGPDSRITATPARPAPVARAAMVSGFM